MKRALAAICILMTVLFCGCGKEDVFGRIDGAGGTPGYLDKDNEVEILLVKEKCTYNSENIMIQKIQYTYDSKGNKLSEVVDDGVGTEVWNEELLIYEYFVGEVDGKIDYSRYWSYDKYGNMLTQEKETPDGKKQLEYNFEYTYENGLPVKQSRPGGGPDYDEYAYNDNGQLIKQLLYRLEFSEPFEYRFEYNSDGILEKIRWSDGRVCSFTYNEQDKLTDFDGNSRKVYRYDSEGKMITQEIYNSENALKEWHEYIYNEDGLLEAEKIVKNESGKEIHETIKYTYEKVKMSVSEAESYYARSDWRWLMEQTESLSLLRK